MKRSTSRWIDRLGTGAMALLLSAIPATAAAQDGARAAQGDAGRPQAQQLDTPVFNRYPDLSTGASRARLAELRGSRSLSRSLDTLAGLLAGNGSHAALADAMRPLLEGQTEAAALDTLAAVMLHYYETRVRGASSTPAQAFNALDTGVNRLAQASLNASASTPARVRSISRR